jgi:hypothetical protein
MTKCARKPALRWSGPGYQHTDMSDRGSDEVKAKIRGLLDKFLDTDGALAPVEAKMPISTEPGSDALHGR